MREIGLYTLFYTDKTAWFILIHRSLFCTIKDHFSYRNIIIVHFEIGIHNLFLQKNNSISGKSSSQLLIKRYTDAKFEKIKSKFGHNICNLDSGVVWDNSDHFLVVNRSSNCWHTFGRHNYLLLYHFTPFFLDEYRSQ